MTTINGLEEFGTNQPPAQNPANLAPSSSDEVPGNSAPKPTYDCLPFSSKVTQWGEAAKGYFISTNQTVNKLPAGVYKYVRLTPDKNAFERQVINVDELLTMPDGLTDQILIEIQDFLNKADKYKFYNFLHRRGYMFYGPHGSGKSSLVQQILKKIVDQDGIVLLCDRPHMLELGLVDLRKVEPDRFIVCLFEDLEALIREWGEKTILAILDGESQVNKVLNIATTNYPEMLDPRIVGRPRRFDRVIRIDWPCAATRGYYFEHKLKIDKAELDVWVSKTDKFSFAACAELVISVKCLGKDLDETVAILRKLMESKPNSKDYNVNGAPLGFGN